MSDDFLNAKKYYFCKTWEYNKKEHMYRTGNIFKIKKSLPGVVAQLNFIRRWPFNDRLTLKTQKKT
jgi:hypothetical protein